jgi:glycosyltransferase involved in cell wall biosynthesis
VQLLREQVLLAEGTLNFSVAANSERLTQFMHKVYGARVLHLPNLYEMDRVARKRDEPHDRDVVNISSFGALRPQKNHASAAAAALMIARERGVRLRFHVNTNRNEGGATILNAVQGLFTGLRWAELIEVPWCSWPAFRRVVADMDLALQVSMTESFNLTTADAVAEGVPAVVTDSIEWAPDAWKVGADDLAGIARVGSALLSSRTGADEGLRALEKYMQRARAIWLAYLGGAPDGRG